MAFILFIGALAEAQPLAGACYSPDRLGWAGPNTALGCYACCGCNNANYSMQWQHRPEDAGWGSQPLSSIVGRFTGGLVSSVTHLERYCMRMRFVDDAGPGRWGPSNGLSCSDGGTDVCFTWDSVPPETPVLLDGGVIFASNRVELHFAPSGDDGGGVGRYLFRYSPTGSSPVGSFGSSPTSPVSDILGAGTWTVSLFAEDLSRNLSPPSARLTVTLGFDASVPPAAAPSWPTGVTRQTYVDLDWSDDGAESWVVTQRDGDGGWFIGARPRVSGLSALLFVAGPCMVHSGRIARVIGDQASDWSPPSPELLVDTIAPVAFAPQLVSFDGGVASLSWMAATDACPSGVSYRLERSVNGSAFSLRTMTSSTAEDDAVDVIGQVRWRVVVVDGAGNQGTSDGGASLFVVAVDGGVENDGGFTTAEPYSLSVGCGCDGGSGAIVLLALCLLRSRRR